MCSLGRRLIILIVIDKKTDKNAVDNEFQGDTQEKIQGQ